jgi:hypothetical protein
MVTISYRKDCLGRRDQKRREQTEQKAGKMITEEKR